MYYKERCKEMSKKIREYLEEKEYNHRLEKLYFFLQNKYDLGINYDEKEIETLFDGGLVSNYVYPWSNERLDEVFEDVELCGKRALVVGSSGDQALHCIHKGATDVTIMDSNMWTKPYVELKMAGIKNLSFEEFKDCFASLYVFGNKYYPRLSHDLSEESKAFWDNIALDMPWYECIDVLDNFFHYVDFGDDEIKKHMNRHSFYRAKEEYEKLKTNLKKANVNIEVADIREFDELAKGQYDYIMLSNISDYMDKEEYFKITKALNEKHLTFDGKMQIGYIFDWERTGSKRRYYRALKESMDESKYGNIKIKKIGKREGKLFRKKEVAENITLER